MWTQAAVTGKKRSLEVVSQSHKDISRRAKLTQGPPKTAHVGSCPQRHLLAKQTAEQWDAFRQNFARSPDAALLDLGGGRWPRASARQTELLVHERLQSADLHAPVGKHVRRDHAPCMPALNAEVAGGSRLLIPLAPATARDRSVTPELPAPPALRAIPGCQRPLRSALGRLKYLHPAGLNGSATRCNPPAASRTAGWLLQASRLRLEAFRSHPAVRVTFPLSARVPMTLSPR